MNLTTETSQPAPKREHKFELAGLGQSPFTVIGYRKNIYVACHGAPQQPGGSCAYCGTGIMNEFLIKSSDGKTFTVGSDCVLKTGDAGLTKTVKTLEGQARREAARIKRQEQTRKIWELRDSHVKQMSEWLEVYSDFLESIPGYSTHSLRDSAEWCIDSCGAPTIDAMFKRVQKALVDAGLITISEGGK